MKGIYLDWASAAPVSKIAERAFRRANGAYANPSSPHAEGVRAQHILEDARLAIARVAGIKPAGVVFTSGATEANNLAIQGTINALIGSEKAVTDIHVLYLPTAHSSIVETVQALKKRGVQVEALVLKDAAIDMLKLASQIRPETALISLDLVCGETGIVWDTRNVRRICNAARIGGSRIMVHVDASQAAFVESLDMNHLGADLLTLDAQKIGGVRGVGALLRAQASRLLVPILYGGGQEGGLRPGTENPALASAFALALVDAQSNRKSFSERATLLRAEVITRIQKGISEAIVNTSVSQAPHILNISLPGSDTDYLTMLLSEAGFAVSTKSACETNEIGSRVILALTKDEIRAASTLRISWGPTTPTRHLYAFVPALVKASRFQDMSSLKPGYHKSTSKSLTRFRS
jgi:cysteine desulfurase